MRGNWYLVFIVLMLYSSGVSAQEDRIALNQYGQEVERVDVDVDTRNSILTFESKDGSYRFWMDNRVYFDGGVFFDKKALNPIGNGLTIRRARFAIKTTMHKNWYGEIDLDFAGATTEMKDMIIKYTNDAKTMSVKAGHFKEGFSMETTTSSRYLTFMERSLVSKFSPSRHLGFQANFMQDKYLLIGGIHFNTQGEFEEVGNSIKSFAADNATVVVGTVIDPDMSGEMRVTVVATGIGAGRTVQEEKPEIKLVKPEQERAEARPAIDKTAIVEDEVVVEAQKVAGGDYHPGTETEDLKYLDIPAFLRRQND